MLPDLKEGPAPRIDLFQDTLDLSNNISLI